MGLGCGAGNHSPAILVGPGERQLSRDLPLMVNWPLRSLQESRGHPCPASPLAESPRGRHVAQEAAELPPRHPWVGTMLTMPACGRTSVLSGPQSQEQNCPVPESPRGTVAERAREHKSGVGAGRAHGDSGAPLPPAVAVLPGGLVTLRARRGLPAPPTRCPRLQTCHRLHAAGTAGAGAYSRRVFKRGAKTRRLAQDVPSQWAGTTREAENKTPARVTLLSRAGPFPSPCGTRHSHIFAGGRPWVPGCPPPGWKVAGP